MGVLCQILAVSKHPGASRTTSRCHGLQKEGPAGAALQAGVWRGPDLFFLHLVILPIIMERLEKFPFMQVSPHFSCCGFPVGPAVSQPLLSSHQDAGDKIGGRCVQTPACFPPCSTHRYTKGLSGDMERLREGGQWHPGGVVHSAPLRGEASPPHEEACREVGDSFPALPLQRIRVLHGPLQVLLCGGL